jgi:hypothetical protein
MHPRSVHFLWDEPQIATKFTSAVSLHSHTDRSHEGLSILSKYAKENAWVGLAVARAASKYRKVAGRELDLQRTYFVPPLTPAAAYRVEASQIEGIGLDPIVSITDHDTIEAPRQLQTFIEPDKAPISVEWTVPFGPSYFHVGLHNLPRGRANEIVSRLREVQCFGCKQSERTCIGVHDPRCLPDVRDLLEGLSSIPHTLIVLNHPLWDVGGLGALAHRRLLTQFLSQYFTLIDALELNGLRTWAENQSVTKIAAQWNLPVVSGGDRHGWEPNAVINLSRAATFAEFSREIRVKKRSVVLFMKQYKRPLALRKLRIGLEVLKSSPGMSGENTRWSDRIFVPWIDGRVLALSSPEWLATLADEPIERPESAECPPGDALHGTEY